MGTTGADTASIRKKRVKKNEEQKNGGEYTHPSFGLLLNMVKNDRKVKRFPWLCGPAGSGKSTLCEAIAKEMKLPFYSVSSLQQKYELEGYCDAAGEYVETTFYKAFRFGGIFLFDEASTTAGEVQIAFNSALANLWYNFPKYGMIQAHPDFHVIAADNTNGRGADDMYGCRYALDASTLDRYITIEIDYTREHDMAMAKGDEELVVFLESVRKVLKENRIAYLASPRSSISVKSFQNDMGFNDTDALFYGLCSSWDRQDIKTICTALTSYISDSNRYYKAFQTIAKKK